MGALAEIAERAGLAQAVGRRRFELELSIAEAARRAGVSRTTWHNVEAARTQSMAPRTLEAFDRALDWSPGTAHGISQGTYGSGTYGSGTYGGGNPELVNYASGKTTVIFEVKAAGRVVDLDEETDRELRRRLTELAALLSSRDVMAIVMIGERLLRE